VDDHYVPLYRFALTLTRSESDAADLTQQTYYVWAAKGHQLRDREKAKTWLFTSLYRAYLSSRRQQERFVENTDTFARLSAPCSASLINKLDGAAAQSALLALPESYRAPLTLFYLQEHTYREIAEILEIPLGTVMSRIARGKVELRKLLTEANGSSSAQEGPSLS
jgi:RNA polymerase sigma-70 factor (ECF subfamily)